jgi:2Fe-2S ferredoxin
MVAHVRIEGTDRAFPIQPGEDLLEVLRAHGEAIATSCGGVAMCGTCRVMVVSGEDALGPLKPRELEHVADRTSLAPVRLACQAKLLPSSASGDSREIVVRLPDPAPIPR